MPFLPPLALSVVAAALTFAPRPALAQPPPEVQPVPYAPSQPVPYPSTASTPPAPPSPPPPPYQPTLPAVGPAVQGNDVVTLKGGGLIRGVLIESIPEDHATIQLLTGQTAVIPWDRIERIERANGGSPAAAGGGAARVAAQTVFVHLESDRPVRLERRVGEVRRAWETVCVEPCDQRVPLDDEYRIAGDGVRKSAPFQLNGQAGDHLVLTVDTASTGAMVGGIVLTGIGPFVMIVGAAIELVAHVDDSTLVATNNGFVSQQTDHSSARAVGWSVLGAGVALTVTGIILLSGNVHSHVRTDRAAPARPQDAWLRTPTWREDKTAEAMPRAVDAPLFHTSF